MKTSLSYLRELHKIQSDILLVCRPTEKTWWGDRCLYLGDGFDQNKQYNHRSILRNEVVIEFDDKNPVVNDVEAKKVSRALKKDRIAHSLWDSGNKSVHCSFFIETRQAGKISLLKKAVMNHYTRNCSIKPDKQLAGDSSLIRMEWGLNEKSGRIKRLIFKTNNHLRTNPLPNSVWMEYVKLRTTTTRRNISTNLDECTCVKYINNSVEFRKNEDGRERALFILIHSLKGKYNKENLIETLTTWYKYSGGFKIDDEGIRRKVNYHYNRDYGTFNMIKDLMEELGQTEIFNTCPVHRKTEPLNTKK